MIYEKETQAGRKQADQAIEAINQLLGEHASRMQNAQILSEEREVTSTSYGTCP